MRPLIYTRRLFEICSGYLNKMLQIHNSLTGKKEPLSPLEPGKVRLYVCGVTVYDYCHLGHARFMVVFDMLCRYLRSCGLKVTYVRNITDIDDKIIKRAAETGSTPTEIVDTYARAMHEDASALGLIAPDEEPRATDHIEQILAMIQRLIDNGSAYAADNGDVYYDVSSFAEYGRLSGKQTSDMRAGARVAVDEAKTDPLDFVLWKAAKPGEPSWESPWGAGRPGWHIECSAMSTHCLGDTFDIHGGGLDLKFPHHENEIAQSEAATGKPFVKHWMHNGFVTVNDEKMAKSLGNFLTIRDVLADFRAEEIRYFILGTHYRSPLAYGREPMEAARAALTRLYQALRGLPTSEDIAQGDYSQRYFAALADDLNTPEAIAVLFEMARETNRLRDVDIGAAAALGASMRRLGLSIGLLQDDPEQYFKAGPGAGLDADAIEKSIAAREAARASRDFAQADKIRDDLLAQGILLEDGAQGTTWRRQ